MNGDPKGLDERTAMECRVWLSEDGKLDWNRRGRAGGWCSRRCQDEDVPLTLIIDYVFMHCIGIFYRATFRCPSAASYSKCFRGSEQTPRPQE